MHTIRLHPLGKEINVNDQTSLIDVLHEFGVEFPCGGRGSCGKCRVRLLEGEIDISEAHGQRIKGFGLSSEWRLSCYSKCTGNITLEIEQFNSLILADETEFEFIPGNGLGIAVDLGTTTIVAQLVDLSSSRVLQVETMLNPQLKFGADLISRIQASIDGNGSEMTGIVRSAIGTMINLLMKERGPELKKVALVGNTVMQHIFCNLDLSPLSVYPFEAPNPGLKIFYPFELDWNIKVTEDIRFFPSVGSFVGSDILAGIVATGMHLKEKYTCLIDLGTNGEIVIGNRDRIVCASTAAGPAFEGSCISMGMIAVTGAISSLDFDNETIRAIVIGNTTPRGICGSALIDAIAIFRKLELIGMFGEINSGETFIPVAGDVKLTQKDINEFLLAKAAIAAGILILAKNLEIGTSGIDEVYLAGGFGNYINIENLTATGMTDIQPDKIHKTGNTALTGAKMFLFTQTGIIDNILGKTKHINLEGDPEFQNIYLDRMLLP